MKDIRIQLQNPTDRGRLYPRYDAEADLLEVTSAVPGEWSYGVDIDGAIIFDLDADQILTNVDVLISKRYWEVIVPVTVPQATREASIRFLEDTIRHKSFNIPVVVQTDPLRSHTYILLGGPEKIGTWIALSNRCLALVKEDCLKGFFIILQ
ncbi:hypothetical protein [Kallotenue papyrolyticum]|uniref:hypothetical protein n=1 Tax=Kallotenue papyrolyticum TaxID=1325125 RepID=UPI001377154A|nr:hypothetical protein [Kallotenue papyrolyticum]